MRRFWCAVCPLGLIRSSQSSSSRNSWLFGTLWLPGAPRFDLVLQATPHEWRTKLLVWEICHHQKWVVPYRSWRFLGVAVSTSKQNHTIYKDSKSWTLSCGQSLLLFPSLVCKSSFNMKEWLSDVFTTAGLGQLHVFSSALGMGGLTGDQNDTNWVSVGIGWGMVGPAYFPSKTYKSKVQACMSGVKGCEVPHNAATWNQAEEKLLATTVWENTKALHVLHAKPLYVCICWYFLSENDFYST